MAISKANAGWWGFPLAITAFVAVAAAISMFIASLGWPIFPEEKVAKVEPKAPEEIASQWKVSPAMVKLTQSLEAPPAGWQGTGTILTSPQTPYPFSCATDGANPVISVAKNFNAGRSSIQVLTTAYSAGLGAQGMKAKFDRSYACAGGDANYALSPVGGIGAEAYQATVSKAGLNTRSIIWRYGDIVVYLIADGNNGNAYSLAEAFHKNMLSKLSGACAVEDYASEDTNRNPFSGSEYKGFFADKKVSIPKVALPKVPEGSPYTATAIPAPAVTVQDVEVPTQPTAYPVWPLLPTAVEKPVAPTAPAKDSPSQKNIRIKAEDVTGPGCGWAFTGSTSPVFDAKAADTFNTAEEKKATDELTAASKKWQESVLKYWDDYSRFKEVLPKWDSYVKNVNSVRAAWDKIAVDWDKYNQAKETYDANVRQRDDFIAAQKAAKTSYESLIKQCEAQTKADAVKAAEDAKKAEEDRKKAEEEAKKAEEEKKNNPTATATPTPTATQTPTPEPTEEAPRVTCPAERPAILDEQAPSVGKAPTPPADPRPVSERN